jgi:hypothetical protein
LGTHRPPNAAKGFYGIYFGGTEEHQNGPAIYDLMKSSNFDGEYYRTTLFDEQNGAFSVLKPIGSAINRGEFRFYDFLFWTSNVKQDVGVQQAINNAQAYAASGQKIALFGWSRGAIKALVVAQELNRLGIQVDYLGLIDPVNTLYYNYNLEIPANVKTGYMSINDNSISLWPWFDPEKRLRNTGKLTVATYTGNHVEDSAAGVTGLKADFNSKGWPAQFI